MSLLFIQWLDPLVDRSLTSVTKTKVFLRNSSAKSSNFQFKHNFFRCHVWGKARQGKSTRIFRLKTFSHSILPLASSLLSGLERQTIRPRQLAPPAHFTRRLAPKLCENKLPKLPELNIFLGDELSGYQQPSWGEGATQEMI